MDRSLLIFGVGSLQRSLIERAKVMGLFTIGIDPNPNAECHTLVDAFEIIDGNDFQSTLTVAEKYKISGLITAATDKPLVMMAQVAKYLGLRFYSVETAEWSTDKLLMKQKFLENNIPCAKGYIINKLEDFNDTDFDFPVIIKPRDNSGSRGVIYCNNRPELDNAVKEAMPYTKKEHVLVEEYIDGKEYSVEGLHYKGKSHVIQITEKITSKFPYNVELGHIQPAELNNEEVYEIKQLLSKIAHALGFENCASHTEVKISSKGIYVIETSPRLGGDFISSTLVPLSTGINMEDILIRISTGEIITGDDFIPKYSKSSGVIYFELPQGIIGEINDIDSINNIQGLQSYTFSLKKGDKINRITSSLNRYGYAIFQTNSRSLLVQKIDNTKHILNNNILIYN